ncbi:MAG: hypothetical protein J0M11_16205 [Anaerolineae bacterium]|nr:hypothetical protein [Anaerolineae bacterium]
MATEFWEAYQSTQKMYDGCAAAIQYAVEHPQILTPLGSDYHTARRVTFTCLRMCARFDNNPGDSQLEADCHLL